MPDNNYGDSPRVNEWMSTLRQEIDSINRKITCLVILLIFTLFVFGLMAPRFSEDTYVIDFLSGKWTNKRATTYHSILVWEKVSSTSTSQQTYAHDQINLIWALQ